jgi:multicomponent Na+:H+ antiporter subunit E
MSLHPRRHRLATQWPTVVWLVAVWVLLWGDLSVGNVLAGAVVAVAVTGLLRMTPIDFHGRIRPLGVLRLVGTFAWDLVHASAEVSWVALRPRHTPRGAVIGVQLRNHSDLYLTVTAELCSLVPGSLVVEAHRLTGMLYLHVLDVEQSGGVEQARQRVLDQEERVLRAFASDDELRDAGLVPARGARRAEVRP